MLQSPKLRLFADLCWPREFHERAPSVHPSGRLDLAVATGERATAAALRDAALACCAANISFMTDPFAGGLPAPRHSRR